MTKGFRRALVVCGPICSGKSSLISKLTSNFAWDVVSFSTYVGSLVVEQDLPITRESMQLIGKGLVDTLSPAEFLKRTIAHCSPQSHVHLIDGIRHPVGIQVVRQLYRESISVFLNVSITARYERYCRRDRQEDSALSFIEFERLCQMPIEAEIEGIRTVADHILGASESLEQTYAELVRVIRARGFCNEGV